MDLTKLKTGAKRKSSGLISSSVNFQNQHARNGLVDLLIRVDNPELHYSKLHVYGSSGSLITRLGPLWVDVHWTDREVSWTNIVFHHAFLILKRNSHQQSNYANTTLRTFWGIENYGTEPKRSDVMTKEQKIATQKVENSLKYNGSHYLLAVKYMWQ